MEERKGWAAFRKGEKNPRLMLDVFAFCARVSTPFPAPAALPFQNRTRAVEKHENKP
jgi:hypothetical protein